MNLIELGTYVLDFTLRAKHYSQTGDCDTEIDTDNSPDSFCGTETYVFHVGPMADLGVADGSASPDVGTDQYAITIAALNNGPDRAVDAEVDVSLALPAGVTVAEHIASDGTYSNGKWDLGALRDERLPSGTTGNSLGEPEETATLTLILEGENAADATATATIANVKDYTVCIGSDRSTLAHTDPSDLRRRTLPTAAAGTTGTVYDHIRRQQHGHADCAAGNRRGGGRALRRPATYSPRSVPAAIVVEWRPVLTLNGWAVSHYEVQRSSSDWQPLADDVECPADAATTTPCRYVDITVEPGQTYSYRVRAVNLPGVEGPWSRTMGMGRTPTAGAPEAPVLAATAKGRTEIELTWDEPVTNGSNITAYQLQVSDTGRDGSWSDVEPPPVPGRASYAYIYPPQGQERLTGGTRKHFRLRATNGQGHSLWSEVVDATTDRPGQAGPPTGVLARGASGADAGSVIIMTWQKPDNDGGKPITGYEVQWSANGASGWRLAGRTDADTLSYEDTGLGWGTTRWYRVAARTSQGLGQWSDPPAPGATAVQDQGKGVSVPGAPTNLRLTPGNAQMTVAWDAPASDGGSPIRGYRVQYRHRDPDRGTSGAWEAWQELSHFTADTSVTMTGMYNYVEYQVKVAAVNGAGTSLYTQVETGIYAPQYAPGEPPNVEFWPGDGQIMVTWREPFFVGEPALTGYRVQWREDADVGQVPWADPTAGDSISVGKNSRSYTIRGLTNGTAYQVRVWAVNAVGDSPKAGEDGKLKATPVSPSPIAGFTLLAGDGTDLGPLLDGDILKIGRLVELEIRANLKEGESVGSLRLELIGPLTSSRTDNEAPYELFDGQGQALDESGTYTLTARALHGAGAGRRSSAAGDHMVHGGGGAHPGRVARARRRSGRGPQPSGSRNREGAGRQLAFKVTAPRQPGASGRGGPERVRP